VAKIVIGAGKNDEVPQQIIVDFLAKAGTKFMYSRLYQDKIK
jgi:hypothetical protein